MPQFNININKSTFNEAYYPYLMDYSKRYNLYFGGAGSGKSRFVVQKILIKAMTNKIKILFVRKVATTLKDSIFQLVIDTLSNYNMLGYCTVNYSTYSITLPNNSVLLFKGLDDSEKLKSIEGITDIVIEEATEISETDFEQLDLRLRPNSGMPQIYLMFNPVSKSNWIYRRYFAKPCTDKDVFILKTTYKDNRFLSAEYKATLEKKINDNPTYYKIYVLGDWCSLNRLVFTNWREEEFDYRDIEGTLLIGLDFGFVNDPSVIVASILADKKLYVFREWRGKGKTNAELAKVIKDLGFAKSVIIADSAEQKSVEEIRRCGIAHIKSSNKGKDSIINGIKKLWEFDIVVHPNCPDLIAELNDYCWQKDKATGEYIEKPVDMYNHGIDALRYSLQAAKTNRIKLFNKSIFGL